MKIPTFKVMALILITVSLPVTHLKNYAQVPMVDSVTYASLEHIKTLHDTLLNGYNTKIRPRLNQSNTVEVNSSFVLNSIINFDTTGQRVDIMGYFNVTWYDDVLLWNSEEYPGANKIKLPLNRIWYPPVIISKTYDENTFIGNSEMDSVKVAANGYVQWVPNGIYNSICEVSVKFYPFDLQICELIYYVSDETVSTVQLSGPTTALLHEYIENAEWRLIEISSITKSRYTTNFVYITFTIERRADFTVYTMIIPIVALAVLNVFTFLVPIESGEKGALAITLFLAYGFFVTITSDALPHNSNQISLYIVYITTLLVVSVLTVIYVIIESKIHCSYGTRQFRLCWSKQYAVRMIEPKSRTENESLPENDHDGAAENGLTWSDMLGRLDTIVFVSSLLCLVVFSSVFWLMVIHRNI